MYPRIYLTGSWFVPTYSLCVTLAIVTAVLVAYIECKRYELPVAHFLPAAFWAVLGGFLGAKAFEIIFYHWGAFVHYPLETLTRRSGWMYYGAECGGFIGLTLYLRFHHLDLLRPFDIGGLVLLLAHAIGRMGCFFAGCCYGIPTNSFLGMTFPDVSCPVHPTQLYESIPLGIMFILVWIFRKRFVVPGTIYSIYLLFYGTLRFIVEYYRDDVDAYRFGILHISPSQYISLAVLCGGAGLFRYSWKRYEKQRRYEDK